MSLAQPPPGADGPALEPDAFFADAGPAGFGPPGPPAFAGPGRPGPHGLVDPRRLADYLQLTDEQRAAARELAEQQRGAMKPMVEQQRDLREQLEALLADPAATDASLGQLVKELHANRIALETARKDLHARFEALLDSEQKGKLEQLKIVMEGLAGSARRGRPRG